MTLDHAPRRSTIRVALVWALLALGGILATWPLQVVVSGTP